MAISQEQAEPFVAELERIHTDALYSAQTYFEAYKRLSGYSWLLIFVPGLASAAAGLALALGAPPWVGAIPAVGGVMSGTATYVGTDRKPASYLRSAQAFTQLRHEARQVRDLALQVADQAELAGRVESLGRRYRAEVGTGEPTSDRDFRVARERISAGIFDYRDTAGSGAGLPVVPNP